MEVKPGYKQTEVGVIPEEWDATKLIGFIGLQRGYDITWRDRRTGDVPVMGAAGQNGFHDTAIAKGPGVVLGRAGASFGQAHYTEHDFWPHNTALYVTDFRGNHPLFVFYFLKSIDFSRYNSGGAQPMLNRNFIYPLIVGVPHPPEQRAIATALSDVDGLLGGLDRLIAKKRDLKQAAMQQLLTGQTRLPGFHGEWEVKRLGDCGEVIMGQSPPGSSYNRTGAGSPLINGPTEFTDRYPVKIQWTTQPTRFCRTGDLLICVRGSSTGRTNYADDKYAIGRGVAAIRARDENDTEFLSYQVISGVSDILTASTGSTFPSVDGASFKKIAIPLPPSVPEQTAIASVLSEMDAELAALTQRREKTRALKQAMMQELLTGRIRLMASSGATE